MALIWTKQLSVGNGTLDSEHKNLIGMVNSIEFAISRRDSESLLQLLKQLKESVRDHFANEERIAEAINLPFDNHKLAHRHLQKELKSTRDELDTKGGMWPAYVMDHYPQFLREWLVEHITKEDMQMKPVLLTYSYDFKPVKSR